MSVRVMRRSHSLEVGVSLPIKFFMLSNMTSPKAEGFMALKTMSESCHSRLITESW